MVLHIKNAKVIIDVYNITFIMRTDYEKTLIKTTLLDLQIIALKHDQSYYYHVRQSTSFWKLYFLPLNEESQHECCECNI